MRQSAKIAGISQWLSPPVILSLGSDEVHVWRARLSQNSSRVQCLEQILAPDERGRAERFFFKTDRDHFIVARALLRTILSRYLGKEPDELRFQYSPYGKPTLANEIKGDNLRFNLSHSHELALFAVTMGREVGVDIEYIRPEFACEEIAIHFFSRREVAALRALPPVMQPEAFFNCWTRKEAYIKARGEGLSIPLDQFDVSLAPGEPAVLLSTKEDPREASRWLLQEMSCGPDYAAAIAAEGKNWRLRCWQWTDL